MFTRDKDAIMKIVKGGADMLKSFLSFLLAGFSLFLAATVFSETTVGGPICIFATILFIVYGLILLYRSHKIAAEIVLELLFNLMMWP